MAILDEMEERTGEEVAGAAWETAGTSLLFGLWHVLPALDLARTNPAIAGSGRRARLALAVVGTVVFTAAAGVLFAELRRRPEEQGARAEQDEAHDDRGAVTWTDRRVRVR